MNSRWIGALFVALSIGLVAPTQSQNSDTLQNLKNSLSPDQQSSILQDVLGGKGSGTGKKTDQKLETPETVRRKNEKDLLDKTKNDKTADGRPLRQLDEDPELRADDTILIELISLDELCNGRLTQNVQQNNNNGQNGSNSANGVNPQPGGHLAPAAYLLHQARIRQSLHRALAARRVSGPTRRTHCRSGHGQPAI